MAHVPSHIAARRVIRDTANHLHHALDSPQVGAQVLVFTELLLQAHQHVIQRYRMLCNDSQR